MISSKFGHIETSSILCNDSSHIKHYMMHDAGSMHDSDVHITARNSAGGGDKRSWSLTCPACSREQRVWSYEVERTNCQCRWALNRNKHPLVPSSLHACTEYVGWVWTMVCSRAYTGCQSDLQRKLHERKQESLCAHHASCTLYTMHACM